MEEKENVFGLPCRVREVGLFLILYRLPITMIVFWCSC